jgi:hypothetical protein
MPHSLPSSVPGVADVEVLRGPAAPAGGGPALLVEVPHGADRRVHYDALRERLVGDLPADLQAFFHVNTDVGAWALGRRVAERVIDARPERVAVVLRCLVPRTFIDCNRLEDATDDLAKGGLTAGLAPYVRHPDDRRHLVDLHRRYVAAAAAAFETVCGAGGLAFLPHTYAPVSVGIERVDDDIVDALRAAWAPGVAETWPARPEIDLITRTGDGADFAIDGAEDAVGAALRAAGFEVVANGTYALHPATQGYRWATAFPGRTLSLEVRRDLLVRRWTPFEEMEVDPGAADRVARPLAEVFDRWLASRGR